MREVVIVSALRTPVGNFQGAAAGFSATDLGAIAIEEAIKKAGISKDMVDEVIMGNVVPLGLGQNPARQAMIKAGLPVEGGAITVNKVCGSGLKAAMLADQAIKCDDADIVAAGGMESMSNIPYYLEKARNGYRMGNGQIVDAMLNDGLMDMMNNWHMGDTADMVAKKYSVSREESDAFSVDSNEKALSAQEQGKFKEEIIPLTIKPRRGEPYIFDKDEGPQRTSAEKLAGLRTVFSKDGVVTAGNASKISDGGSCLVLMSMDKAKELGLKPLAKVIAHVSAGIELADVLVAPINSIPKLLKKSGFSLGDIDLFEVNEAFAVSTLAVIKELGIDPDKVNLRGGAVAIGHPIGCSGARVLTTMLHTLIDEGKRYGMASLCLGGGEAVSMLVENIF